MKQGIDYIGVTVCFFCYDKKGNLLLQKRSKNCRDEQGKWDCGGGSVRFGETAKRAALREIKEEYCCKPVKLNFIAINNVLRKYNGKQTHWIAIIFAAQLNPKDVKIGVPRKMDKIGWFKPNKLPTPLHSMYLSHLGFVRKAGII